MTMFSSSFPSRFVAMNQPVFPNLAPAKNRPPQPHFNGQNQAVEQIFQKLEKNEPINPKALQKVPASALRETSSTGETVATRLLRLHAETKAAEKKEAAHSLLVSVYKKIGPQAFLGSATYFAKSPEKVSQNQANALLTEMVRVARDVPEHLDDAKTAIKSLKEKKQSRPKNGQVDSSARLFPFYEQFEAGISRPKTPAQSPQIKAADATASISTGFSTLYNSLPDLGLRTWWEGKSVAPEVAVTITPRSPQKVPQTKIQPSNPFADSGSATKTENIPELNLNKPTPAPKSRKRTKNTSNQAPSTHTTNSSPAKPKVAKAAARTTSSANTALSTPKEPSESIDGTNWEQPKNAKKTIENLKKSRAQIRELRARLAEYEGTDETPIRTRPPRRTTRPLDRESRVIPKELYRQLDSRVKIPIHNLRKDAEEDRATSEFLLSTLLGREEHLETLGAGSLDEVKSILANLSKSNSKTGTKRLRRNGRTRRTAVSSRGVHVKSPGWQSTDRSRSGSPSKKV